MKTSDFTFNLPPDRIAQFPPERRGESRLMVLRRGAVPATEHSAIRELPRFVGPGTVVVLNNSRVRKARLYGRAEKSGGQVEFLLLRRAGDEEWEALVSKGKRQRPGKRFLFPGETVGTITREAADARVVRFSPAVDDAYLERYGHVPLPPYIKREDVAQDAERYQTVFAATPGSVAAPTAGLHFTPEILSALRQRGATVCTVTLHVGLGTFAPIRSDDIEAHRMHEEEYEIGEETARLVTQAKRDAHPVLAVGTTAVRTLESAWDPQAAALRAGSGATSLFVTPGFTFRVVDHLLTNFHTPRSSLLVLVSAFAGRKRILAAYQEALDQGYRFFSYGDAMLIL
jgi:S-adenosylmethionine:tRNA ribosyltransferase-isomerase